MAKILPKKLPPADLVETFDCEQGSDEWFQLHVGIPSASRFAAIMADGRGGDESVTRRKLVFQLAAERMTDIPSATFSNADMQRGKDWEPAAREAYARRRFEEVKEIGFVKRTISNALGVPLIVGCSPDALVGEDGLLEIKTSRPEIILELAERGASGASGHRAQVQGQLWVTGRAWCDLFHYGGPGMEHLTPTFRIERDEAYIARLRQECERFEWEVQQLVLKYPKVRA